MKAASFLFAAASVAAIPFFSGCNSTCSVPLEEQQALREFQENLQARDSAEYFIPQARSFAIEQLPQLDEKTCNYILENPPTILTKSDGMLILFYWKSPDWERGVQVVASAAPLGTPLAANVVDRPRFP